MSYRVCVRYVQVLVILLRKHFSGFNTTVDLKKKIE